MKKLLLFIGLTALTFGAFAEKVPSVIVTKSQGGFTALLNLYNYVQYTPAELTATGIAELNCTGSGFSACRIPNCTSLSVNTGTAVTSISDASKVNAFMTAINDVITQYETAQEQASATNGKLTNGKAVSVPNVYTKTISMSSAGGQGIKKAETYVIRGVVTTSSANSSTMKIYIEKVSLPFAGSN